MKTAPAEAQSYAQALFALAEASQAVKTIENDLSAVVHLISDHPDIRRFMADINIRVEGKYAAFEELLQARIHPVLLYFMLMLLSQGKLKDLDPIAERYYQLVSSRERKISGELVTNHPLSPAQLSAIEQEVGRMLNKDIRLSIRENPGMLGGFWIRVGDFILDGTMEGQLEAIRKTLLS